jgi:uncharacterized peroxidase-related enzyme
MNTHSFTLYSKDAAPEPSRALLGAVEAKFGFIPNVLRQIAEAPAALGGTLQLMEVLGKSSLSPAEQWIALLVVAFQNSSSYCVAANSTVARMMGVPANVVEQIRKGHPLPDSRLEALRHFTAEMVHHRGQVSPDTTRQFLKAGFTKAQVFEVILAVALETVASYTDRAVGTPMDTQFQANAWTRPVAAGVA